MNLRSDEGLVREIQSGDISSYEEMVRRYQQRLFAFAYRIVGNREDAQEVVQDSLFTVYRNIEHIDPSKKFSSFIFTVTKNEALSKIRGKKTHVPLELVELADKDQTIYEQCITNDQSKRLKHIINSLDRKYKTVIELYYFGDLSYEEISKKCSMPLNTVRTRLKRSKELLRRKLLYETY